MSEQDANPGIKLHRIIRKKKLIWIFRVRKIAAFFIELIIINADEFESAAIRFMQNIL